MKDECTNTDLRLVDIVALIGVMGGKFVHSLAEHRDKLDWFEYFACSTITQQHLACRPEIRHNC